MVHCSLPGCDSREKKGMSFFRYPDIQRSVHWNKWKFALEKFYKNKISLDIEKIFEGKICYLHFTEKHIIWNRNVKKRFLTENAIPTKFKNIDLDFYYENLEIDETPSTPNLRSREPRTTAIEYKPAVIIVKNGDPTPPSSKKYEKNCRLCLVATETEKSNILTQATKEKVEILINTSLNVSDDFPSLICKSCSRGVTNYIQFREKILKNQETLVQEIFNVVEIKQEAKEELEDDRYDCAMSFGAPSPNYQYNDDTANNEVHEKKEDTKILTTVKCEDYNYKPYSLEILTENDEDSEKISDSEMSDDSWKLDKKDSSTAVKKIRYQKRKYGNLSCEEYGSAKVACEACGKVVARRRMEAHFANFHEKENCKYQCDLCGSKFFHKYLINNHVLGHIKIKAHTCDICQKSYRTRRNKFNHIRRVHTGNNEIFCHLCAKVVKSQQSLMKHIVKDHKKERNYVCGFQGCTKTFATLLDKQTHISYGHSGPQSCDECGLVVKSKNALRIHKLKHGGKTFSCEQIINGVQCGKIFYNVGSLRSHAKTHIDHRDNLCPICGAGYKYKKRLIEHYIANHSSFKLYCLVEGCDAAYSNKDALRSHVKSRHSHHGEEFLKFTLQRITEIRIPKLEELTQMN